MGTKIQHVKVEEFRSFHDVEFDISRKITVISGQNGVGKSNLISLIASGSGLGKSSAFGGNFQPKFYDFFYISPEEAYDDYTIYLRYGSDNTDETVLKCLTFKNDTESNRGIRIIPRTSNKERDDMTIKEAELIAKENFNVGGAARIPIPTIYLSISRLYPLGERKESVSVKEVRRNNKLYHSKAHTKFCDWYNSVMPGSIKQDGDLSIVDKEASTRSSLHMEMENTPALGKSVGQDNLGNIISALVDIYILSQQDNYNGALICIDEIEVSLHPDTQMRLLDLMDKLANELNIQFVVTTHSLTVLKELLGKHKKNPNDYGVVYLKNPSAPMVTVQQLYEFLKADLLGKVTYQKPKPKVYFEDEVGKHLFNMLVGALYHQCSTLEEGGNLRGNISQESAFKIKSRLEKIKKYSCAISLITPIVTSLGCEELLRFSQADRPYSDQVIFLLDGDARHKQTEHKPKIREYLDRKYDPHKDNLSDRETKRNNICFFPDYFAPESFLYRMMYQIMNVETNHTIFWRTLDQQEETALYTASKIRSWFVDLASDFNNDDLKNIFGDIEKNGKVWTFIDATNLLNYYYGDYSTIEELILFFEKFDRAFQMTYSKMIKNI
ncbi:AAA family ATPase [uncultured Selenomonas sp.]|uniref:ATP-dependent nuclease n=1 Tax=uncultured Selenomonas sp. TaxID=159275 RepID=UPI0028EB1979|nr:AAA family ATPase [uncultured Selenomonas sp.]